MNKKIILIVAAFSRLVYFFASEVISDDAQKMIDDFMNLRMTLALCETDELALKSITDFETQVYKKNEIKLSDQEKMIMDNFIVTERYNYLKKTDEGILISDKELFPHIDENYRFYNENVKDGLNGWWYVTAANVIGCYMSFHPVSVALKYGNIQKKYYETAYNQDIDFSYGVAHMAQWYFLAPGFYGGSKKKAESLFIHAIETARNPAESYFTNIYMSQYYFEMKRYDESEKYLNVSESILPDGSFVKLIREINSKGISTFYYKEE